MTEEQQLDRLRAVAAMGVRGLRSGQDWEAWLYRAEPLVPIRFANTMLVWAQRPQASMLLSRDDWQRHGRQVTPGERGIWVIAHPDHAGAGGEQHPAVVLDIPQTHGEPVPTRARHPPYPEGPPAGAWEALTSLALREGFHVQRGDCAKGDAFITWRDRRIHVRRDADETTAVTALAHQLGHVLLHADSPYLEGTSTLECSGTRKVEADSVTVLVAARLRLPAPAITFPYVPSWAGEDERAHPVEVVQAVGERILRGAAKAFACLDAVLAVPTPPASAGLDVRAARTSTPLSAGTKPAAVLRGRVNAADNKASVAVASTLSTATGLQATAERFYIGRLRGSWASVYLESRGLGESIQQAWHIGYAPAGWTTFTDHLRDLGYKDADIEAAGLARRSSRRTLIDTFRERAMFPVRAPNGTTAGFIGRARPGADEDVPKYINSPGSDLYRKGDLLFGLHEARSALADGAVPVIVEGPLDAIAVSTATPGQYAGLAPCGTALTPRQLATLAEITNVRETGIIVALDSDRAGQDAAIKAYDPLREVTDKITAVVLPPGQDPAGLLETSGRSALAAALKDRRQPLADLVIDANIARWERWLQFIEGRFNALLSTAPLIAKMPPAEIARQVARVAQQLDMSCGEVTAVVTDAISGAAANPKVTAPPKQMDCGTIDRSSPATTRTVVNRAALDHPHPARDAVRSSITSTAVHALPRNRTAGASRTRPPNPRPR